MAIFYTDSASFQNVEVTNTFNVASNIVMQGTASYAMSAETSTYADTSFSSTIADFASSVDLTSTQVFATGTTTINAATYIDITGCSVSLAAGTWLITGHVVGAAVNAIIQCFVAIRDGANNVIAASAMSRPASGTNNLNSPIAITWSAIVSPTTTTTYKLSAARGLTTHTTTWTVYDGTGYNTTNHATDNNDLGTNILAIKIATPTPP